MCPQRCSSELINSRSHAHMKATKRRSLTGSPLMASTSSLRPPEGTKAQVKDVYLLHADSSLFFSAVILTRSKLKCKALAELLSKAGDGAR